MNVFSPQVLRSTSPQVHRSTLLHINGYLLSTRAQVHRSTLLHINECLLSTRPQVHRSTGPQVHTTSYKSMSPVHKSSGLQDYRSTILVQESSISGDLVLNFPGFFPIATNGDYMLAKIVGSSFSAGERSDESCR